MYHLLDQPGILFDRFYAEGVSTITRWQTWNKPPGSKYTFIMAVGGGASGGNGINTGGVSGGGGGGGSGGFSSLLVPSNYVPGQLHVQPGSGGKQTSTSGALCVAGTTSYVYIQPATTATAPLSVLTAIGAGVSVTPASITVGGTAGPAGGASTIAQCNFLAPYAIFMQLLVGHAGSAGGIPAGAGAVVNYPATGLLLSGGAGGGGCNGATGFTGGSLQLTKGLGANFWDSPLSGGSPASGGTPAFNGRSGIEYAFYNMKMYWGGAGGGGSTTTAGGNAGAGGNGAPGCGGGGGGGANTTNTTIGRGGDGGDGFVVIASIF